MADDYNANLLRERRKALKLTQVQVAEMAGIEFRQYQRYEYGERDIICANMRVGISLCKALQIDPFELIIK